MELNSTAQPASRQRLEIATQLRAGAPRVGPGGALRPDQQSPGLVAGAMRQGEACAGSSAAHGPRPRSPGSRCWAVAGGRRRRRRRAPADPRCRTDGRRAVAPAGTNGQCQQAARGPPRPPAGGVAASGRRHPDVGQQQEKRDAVSADPGSDRQRAGDLGPGVGGEVPGEAREQVGPQPLERHPQGRQTSQRRPGRRAATEAGRAAAKRP